MRKDKTFDRKNFEIRVIEPVLQILSECAHVVLFDFGQKKGQRILYNKVKKGGMVEGYEVIYFINMTCKKIKPKTILAIKENPQVVKIAQDILSAEKKPQKVIQPKARTDYKELEKVLYNR